jgi:hypothetical protein
VYDAKNIRGIALLLRQVASGLAGSARQVYVWGAMKERPTGFLLAVRNPSKIGGRDTHF